MFVGGVPYEEDLEKDLQYNLFRFFATMQYNGRETTSLLDLRCLVTRAGLHAGWER